MNPTEKIKFIQSLELTDLFQNPQVSALFQSNLGMSENNIKLQKEVTELKERVAELQGQVAMAQYVF
jgi:hypothetical protein